MLFRQCSPWLVLSARGVMPPGGGAAVPLEGGAPPPGIISELSGAFTAARAALSGFVELLTLEAQRAGRVLGVVAICVALAAVCLVATWLGLMTALALWAASWPGVTPPIAFVGVALINGAAAALLLYLCLGMSRGLLFPASRRQLAGKSPENPAADA